MKAIIITAAIYSFTMFNNSYATRTINMKEKLEEVVKFKSGALPLEKNKYEFVKVSFRINEEGKVEILNMNYSDEGIKVKLMEKLSELKIKENHNTEEVYNYNFTFKKL